MLDRLGDFFGGRRHDADICRCLFRCRCGCEGLFLIARGAVRHVPGGTVHSGSCAIERLGDIRYRPLKLLGRAFDKLPAGFQRAGLFALFMSGAGRVRGRLAEEQKCTTHICDFVAAVVLNVDIQIAISDAAHGIAEEAQTPRDTPAHVKPCHEHGADHRRDRQHDQDHLPGADLPAGVTGYLLGDAPLFFDKVINGVL